MSDDLAGVLFRHRERLKEIVSVLSRYGFARLADHAAEAGEPGMAGRLVNRMADPELASMSTGQRLRGALSELGTTWIKLGQMLSLRPDLVGPDVAAELAQLQADVPADPPGSAEQTIKTDLGRDVSEAFSSFEAAPMASASVAQAHRATLPDGTAVVVKVVHAGARARVLDDLELMRALAGYVESHDETLAAYSPSVVVDEFDTMMRAAIDLRQELANLQQFTANFADEPDIVIPTPYADLCGPDMLTMSLVTGQKLTGRDGVTAAGWDVDDVGAARIQRLPGDGVPGRHLPRRPASGELLAPRRAAPGHPRLRRRRPPYRAAQGPARGLTARRRLPGRRRADRRHHRPHPRPGRPRRRQAERPDRHLAQPLPRRQHRRSRHGRRNQRRHADHAQQPADLPRRPRTAVSSPGPSAGSGRRSRGEGFPHRAAPAVSAERWPPNVSTHARSADGPSAACAAGNASSPMHQGRSGRCCSSSRTAPST